MSSNPLILMLSSLIESIRSNPVHVAGPYNVVLVSDVKLPEPFSSHDIELQAGVGLPDDLVALWTVAGEIRLFVDERIHSSGLLLWPPSVTVSKQKRCVENLGQDYRSGDLVIGEFVEDVRKVVLRCNINMSDFGAVLVTSPIDPRQHWYVVAPSLHLFLEWFVKQQGMSYWENNT